MEQIDSDRGSPKAELSTRKNEFIINLCKEVLYNSLAQSIIKIVFTPHKILKVFLSIFALLSSCLAAYLVLQSIMTYFTYGVTSTSRTIYETPTLFPKVTFCNVNPFTTQYAYNLTRKGIFDGSNLLDAEKQKLSHDLEDILFECWFNDKQCYASDFTWSYHQMYGNCFTFNGNETNLKKSYLIGPDYGLQLVLYVKVYESLLNITDVKDKLGAVIRVGNSSFSKFVSNGGIFVSSGFSTYIQVDREFISMLLGSISKLAFFPKAIRVCCE